ncbi:nidogen-2 isoform X2 [Cyprinus carpio]|uniref:Nidogen-2 isoform X2 n=1 Tax=Cyprinus carpio TaxID=7962 RepID=A0A9Q9X9S2_CYPCA|nr:nidogen-2 isoform X2 [Cyprinus carpio]
MCTNCSLMTWDKIAVFFLQLSWTVQHVTAIHRHDIYPYGMFYGDAALQAGDDETSEVITLTKPMYFYEASFNNLYVATNGIISTQDLPMEKQYVDDGFPTDFPVIAPFLADIDTSKGKGSIFYRQTESPTVLKRAEADVKRGFPDTTFTPTHAFIATWENVSAYEEVTRSSRPSNRVNTFQVVLAYNERDTYALFLYPEDGLQFFGSRPKESYYVEIELPARVGFTRGELSFLFFSRTEGPYYSVTSDEQSVKNLYQKGNIGERGVWLFHIGNRYSFQNVVPAQHEAFFTKAPPVLDAVLPDEDYSETDEEEYDPIDPDFQDPTTTEFLEPEKDSSILERLNQEVHLGQSPPQPSESGPGEFPQPDPHSLPPEDVTQPQQPLPKHAILQVYPNRVKDVPPSGGQVFSVEEKVDFDSGVIHYSTDNKETCERFQQQCSQNAHCTDYSTGFCCHCNSGFYGNGQHCLPNGAPHRVNGKVRGTVLVGGTAVQLDSIDLHAYIVVGDGRAYTAISEVPEPVGWALMPVAPIGGLFGWLFALELPNSLNGFSITGAEFTRRADVIFYPGNQRLSIVQTATGLDTQNYLNVDTHLQGSVPFIPPGATVQMEPFKDTYHYYPSLITSTSVREFTVTSAENGAETHSFQVKQNITYRDCTHGPRSRLETLELRMERIFVMYVKEERILRYAITNKIGPLGAGDPEPEDVNPCYSGNHDCDTTAQCMPGEGQLFSCQCATGYRGDGRNCYDVDECAEGLSSCGAHSYCVNLPGSHRCQCESGFEFGFDGRTCQDVDECRDQPCHTQALCSNSLGSFHCQCQPGYHGDGFQCHFQNGRPKTHCEQHRDSLRSRDGDVPLIGAFIPQCDEEGQYRPQQCHGSTGHCWCVDSRGQERAGTRTPPGAPTINCDEPVRPERPKTHCEQHRDSLHRGDGGVPLIGAFIPQCDEEGQYRPQQCHGSTGHCWCVDSRGQERAGTRTPPGAPTINCDEPERPKTHCEQHRDSLRRGDGDVPLIGAFIPQCDEEGQYRPQQCHGSTGHCWCVDSRGQERAGTRTPPGAPTINCDEPVRPERPKTHCEQHRDSLQSGNGGVRPIGAFIPQCDEEGQYRPQQCQGSTGHCWCVDSRGQERAGTRTPPGAPTINCDEPVHPERPKTHCEQHRDSLRRGDGDVPLIGAFIPQCDEGQYRPQQCHGSTGHCWCVDSRGQERAGTRTPPGAPTINCDEPVRPKTQCEQHRDSLRSRDDVPLIGAFIPQCDEDGQYRPQQCHGSTGHCWCVDSRGQERAGTRTPPGAPTINCDEPVHPERPKTHCEQHRDSLRRRDGDVPLIGAFIPQCDDEGQYRPQQCHGSTGHCWCVDSRGQERAGTRTPPGAPTINCDEPVHPERPKTHCEQHRDSLRRGDGDVPLIGAFIPQCDEEGQYRPQQCHGSTGHCWCVDSRGQERAGTRTPPGAPTINCDEPVHPERPKTHCEQHRDSLRRGDGDVPLIGAFIPQCDEEGQYRPPQCHGSTGHCWCVDSRGQERAGTRTPPGAPTINCDEPVHPERPKTHCEQHRDSLRRGDGDVPLIGAFIPQCDEEGQYRPQQCQGSTGHCWCVDSRGQERAGTRTPPGAPTINCDEPVHPERPKTHCEQHRDSLQSGNGGVRPIGAFIPQCDEEGQYRPQQCHGSTGHCWCVDSRGQERAGTKTPPGAPAINCDEPVRPKTHCEQHRDSLRSRDGDVPLIGAFIPQCDEEGQYRPQQCHGSTGHCWCVDSRGQERAGTRTPPGAPAINCDEPVPPVQRPETVCERWRASLMQQYGGQPDSHHYLPQCDSAGEFNPVQCYGDSSYCWCVDQNGREVPGTRSHDAVKPACIPTVAPPTMHPLPRPDVTPPPSGTSLLYAQGQQIGVLPLIGTQMDKQRSSVLLALHGSIVVGIDYDCRERKVYWTDLAGRTINRASLEPGSEPEIIINTALTSPEGLAIDVARRRLFWVDSTSDKIETANLDGSDRRVLFDTDLVNPRAIIVHSPTRTLYWTDWNREAPKIESSSVDGQNRRVLVQDGIGLPNALTHDSTTGQVCWADAGTKRLECISPNGTGRRVVHSNLNYPFSMVAFTNHYYYTDWRRDGVIALNRDNQSTDEHLPDQRSHLYGITVAPPHCL